MTDHLEPYRRMARSMKFFPPLSLNQPSQEPVPATPLPLGLSPSKPLLDVNVTSAEPPIDPSERAATLVQQAVSKPTVLPASYAIQENIGDRISRLKSAKPVAQPVEFPSAQFKIPQPDPNWTSTQVNPATESGIDPSEHVAALVREAVSKPTELPSNYTILENIGDRISRMTSPQSVDADIASPQISKPEAEKTSAPTIEPEVEVEQTSAPTIESEVEVEQTSAPTIESEVEVEQTSAPTIESQPIEAETKKSIDDTHLETSSDTDVAEAPLVEESHSDNSAVGVVETLEVEETPDEDSSAVVGELAAVADTTDEKSAAESVEVEETPNEEPVAVETEEATDTNPPVAEAEEAQPPSLLERISSVVETVATVFKSPNTDRKDSEPVTEPSPSDSAATEATVEPLATDTPVPEAENAQDSSLLERVSTIVEAVATTLNPSKAEEKNSEVAVEPEPTPTVPQQPLSSKTVGIACPSCESTDLKKNGRRQGKQKYVCTACGKQFVISDAAEAEEQLNIQTTSPVETPKAKGSTVDTAVVDSTSGSSKSLSKKKKTKAKGFGASKKDK